MNHADINILVVDDDEGVRRNLEKALHREGYTVEVAEDSQSACVKLDESPIHLAILDLRMPDLEGKFSGRAGIDLLEWIKKHHPETFVMVLTGAGTVPTAVEAVNLGADYIEKDHLQPRNLKEKIKKIVKINYDLKINFRHDTKLSEIEDEEILRRLFVECSEIKVLEIAQGSRGTTIYQITSRNLNGEWRVPFATKIAWKNQILKEEKNYHQWVKHRLGGVRYASMLESAAYSFKRGGINMSFLSIDLAGLREFKTFFRNHNKEIVSKVISNLFSDTLSYWYESKEPEQLSLIKEYAEYLNAGNWNLRRSINRHLKEFKDSPNIELEQINVSFPNPIKAFERLLELPHLLEKRTYISTTHGDLHASNILVDNQNKSWLIDFSNTGRSHILRDFIELETSIKFDLIDVDAENLKALYNLELSLLSQNDFRSPPKFVSSHEIFQKTFEVVTKIREYAYLAVAPSYDMQEYYIGLLFYSLNMLRFSSNAVSKAKKICILYSASLILESLDLNFPS